MDQGRLAGTIGVVGVGRKEVECWNEVMEPGAAVEESPVGKILFGFPDVKSFDDRRQDRLVEAPVARWLVL